MQYRSSIVQSVLQENGIKAVIVNKKDSAYQIFGEYEVHVDSENLLKAINIVKNEISFE